MSGVVLFGVLFGVRVVVVEGIVFVLVVVPPEWFWVRFCM